MNMKSCKIFSVAAAALSCYAVFAGKNMLFNSGFELGTSGYTSSRRVEHIPGKEIKYPGPALNISDKAYSGRYSVVLNGCETDCGWSFCSHDFKLVPGKTYTFSAWVRSDNTNRVSFHVFSAAKSTYYAAHKKTLPVTKEWKRQSFTFTYIPPEKRSKEDAMNYFFIFSPATGKNTQVYLDNIQFEEGTLTDYKAGLEMESAVNSPAYVIEDKKVTAEVSAVSEKAGNVAVTVELAEQLTGKIITSKKVNIPLEAGKGKTVKVVFDKVPYGGLVFKTSEAHSSGAGRSVFVRLHKNDRVYGKGFQVGIHGSHCENIIENLSFKGRKLGWFFTDCFSNAPGDMGKVLRYTGATHIDPWYPEVFSLAIQTPEQRGKYDWRLSDDLAKRARANNLKFSAGVFSQAIMTNHGGKDTGICVPQWVRKLDRHGLTGGKAYGDWSSCWIVLPPPEIISEYIVEVAKRYRNDIIALRLFAESNGYMTPEMLHEYAVPFYTEAKKAVPEIPVITMTPTQDQGSKIGGYMEKGLQTGTGSYTDHVAIHPYASATDDAVISAMTDIRTLRKLIDRYKKSMQIWNTEVYHLTPVHGGNGWTREQFKADAISRRFCIDAGEGVAVSCPMFIGQLFANPGMVYRLNLTGGLRPTVRFAAYNAVAHFLCGSTDHKVVFTEGNILAYTFRNHGKKWSMIWSIDGKAKMNMALPAGCKLSVYDMFGNLTGVHTENLQMALGRFPTFIEWSGKSVDPVEVHRKADIENQEEIRVESVKLLHDSIRIYLTNRRNAVISGFVRIQSTDMKTRGRKFSNIQPFASFHVDLPMSYTGSDLMGDVQGTVMITGENSVLKHHFRTPKITCYSLPFEAQINKWSKMKAESVNGKLQITVTTPEASFTASPKADTPWYGSSVEFFFDLTPENAVNGRLISRYTPACFQVGFSTAKEGKSAIHAPKGKSAVPISSMTADVRKSGKGHVAVFTMPLPQNNFAFNAQSSEFGETFSWKGSEIYRNRSTFQLVKVK